ncbi:MAG: hypothetical protein JWR39_2749, partial [Devosia sp.]|nr:hypothetical protein [Devosia sp.]
TALIPDEEGKGAVLVDSLRRPLNHRGIVEMNGLRHLHHWTARIALKDLLAEILMQRPEVAEITASMKKNCTLWYFTIQSAPISLLSACISGGTGQTLI